MIKKNILFLFICILVICTGYFIGDLFGNNYISNHRGDYITCHCYKSILLTTIDLDKNYCVNFSDSNQCIIYASNECINSTNCVGGYCSNDLNNAYLTEKYECKHVSVVN